MIVTEMPARRAHVGKVRLVMLGGALVAIPFVTLTILPEVLIQQTLIPYSIAFLLLGILPLTYGYAIFRLRLIEIDAKINRGATFILVYSLIGQFLSGVLCGVETAGCQTVWQLRR